MDIQNYCRIEDEDVEDEDDGSSEEEEEKPAVQPIAILANKDIEKLLSDGLDVTFDKRRSKWKNAFRHGLPFDKRAVFMLSLFDVTTNKAEMLYDSMVGSAFANRIPQDLARCRIPTFSYKPFSELSSMIHPLSTSDLSLSLLLLNKKYQGYLTFCPNLGSLLSILLTRHSIKQTLYIINELLVRSTSGEKREELRWWFTFDRGVYQTIINGLVDTLRSFRWGRKLAQSLRLKDFNLYQLCEDWLSTFFHSYFSIDRVETIALNFCNEGIRVMYRYALGLLSQSRRKLHKAQTSEEIYSILHSTASAVELNFDRFVQKTGKISLSQRHLKFRKQKINSKLIGSVPQTVFRPRINIQSQIVEDDDFEYIWDHLPRLCRGRDAVRLFSTEVDGVALQTLYQKCQAIDGNSRAILLLIRDSRNSSFGCFLTQNIRPTNSQYLHNGEGSFVFSFRPAFEVYPAQSESDQFFVGGKEYLGIGGGKSGMAITLNEDLSIGHTNSSATFNNKPLTVNQSESFVCKIAEVYAIA